MQHHLPLVVGFGNGNWLEPLCLPFLAVQDTESKTSCVLHTWLLPQTPRPTQIFTPLRTQILTHTEPGLEPTTRGASDDPGGGGHRTLPSVLSFLPLHAYRWRWTLLISVAFTISTASIHVSELGVPCSWTLALAQHGEVLGTSA